MKTIIILLLLFQYYSYGQEPVPVYIEDTGSKTNSDQNKGKDYRSKKIEDWLQLDSKFSQINRGDSPIGKHSKNEFLDVIEANNKILFFIESNRMLTKCAEINELRKNESPFDNCKIVKTAFDFLKSQNKKAVDLIKELEAKGITTFKAKDATLSLGKSSTVSNTNDKAFWNGKEEKVASKTTSKNEDDFWNGKTEKIADNSKEDDFWNGKEKTQKKELRIEVGKSILPNELEIFGENSNYGLRNKRSGKIILSANNYEIDSKEGNLFVVKKKGYSSFNKCHISTMNDRLLYDKKGLTKLEPFWNGGVSEGKLIIQRILRKNGEEIRYSNNKKQWYRYYDLENLTYDLNLKLIKREVEVGKQGYSVRYKDYEVSGRFAGRIWFDCDKKIDRFN